ncbi:MAG: hypothetical protein AAGU21_13700 [Solidesulfovibrio sp.]|uniref:hypothetical protein n=1 Tax=Solidesulfovibrio sp. TaxID=2910990 RepID=UPI002B2046B7|nr:hypothetical protein [Solidesulfovibrio sp.]MEA4857741.1 hypothetical protein [Solidesulfovibrio sp.]
MPREKKDPVVGASDRIYFDLKGGKSATYSKAEGWQERSPEPGEYRPLPRFRWLRNLLARIFGR